MKGIGDFKGPLKIFKSDSRKQLEEYVNDYIAEQKELYDHIYLDIDFKVDEGMIYAFVMVTPADTFDDHQCSCGECH